MDWHLYYWLWLAAASIITLVLFGFDGEFLQQFFLSFGEMHGYLRRQLDIKIAPRRATQDRHALVLEPDLMPRLNAGIDFHFRHRAVDDGHLDRAAQRR